MAPLLHHDVIAVNFQTRFDVSMATAEEILADARHTERWATATSATRTAWARSLVQFAGNPVPGRIPLDDGDVVLAVADRRKPIHVGIVAGAYRYCPDFVPQHPHVRPVDWGGAVTHDLLAAAGSSLPGIAVPTIGIVGLNDEAWRIVNDAATTPKLDAVPRVRGPGRPAAAAQAPPRDAMPVPPPIPSGKRIPVPTWQPPEDRDAERVPCEKLNNKCDGPNGELRHTFYRYLYRALPPVVDDDGHDLLVIAFNPNCPDDTSSPTFQFVGELAAEIGTRLATVTNVIPRRSATPKLLNTLDISAAALGTNRRVVADAISDAALVVVGWGQTPVLKQPTVAAEREWITDRLDAEHTRRGLPVAQFGERMVHPSKWKSHARRTNGRYRPWLVPLGTIG